MEEEEEMVEIAPNIEEEINCLMNFKTSKGRTHLLLKKKSAKKRRYTDIKHYPPDLSKFKRRTNPFIVKTGSQTIGVQKFKVSKDEEMKTDKEK